MPAFLQLARRKGGALRLMMEEEKARSFIVEQTMKP